MEKSGIVELKGVGKYPHVVVQLPSGTGRGKMRRDRGKDDEGKNGIIEGTGGKEVLSSSGGKREVVVEFGSVAVGTSTQKWIELVNVSPVSSLPTIYVCTA